MTPPTRDADAVRFNALWKDHSARVLAYATRHIGRDDAQEILAETFLIAWRRLADVPGQPLPWLLVVARNTIANHRRSSYRRAVLHEELARLHAAAAPAEGVDVSVTERAEVLSALAAMSAKEREALLLITWDGLAVCEAARVAGCSTSAMHMRLFRARRALRAGATGTHDASGAASVTATAKNRVAASSPSRPPRPRGTPLPMRTASPTSTTRSLR